MPTVTATIHDLARRWAAAEQANDDTALGELAVPDFRLVGPVGFVLDRNQWSHRYTSGDLRTDAFDWEPTEDVRDLGGCAVVIGIVTQRATHQGQPVGSRFRVTLIAVTDGERWHIAGLHFSPLAGPAAG